MKQVTKIALAVALIGGVSATALTFENASARGWNNNGQEQGQQFKGPYGGKQGRRGMGPAQHLKQFDANKDGTLTKEELTAGIEAKINENDKDGDGAITLEEFKAEWAKQTERNMVRAYQYIDPNGDGKVTLEELTERSERVFERMDRNDDGKLDESDRPEKRYGKRGGQKKGLGEGKRGGQFQQGNFEGGQFGPRGFGRQPNQAQGPQAPLPPLAQVQ